MKRFLSMLLAVVMLVSLFPVASFAQETPTDMELSGTTPPEPEVVYYAVMIDSEIINGTVATESTEFAAGDTVELTVTPNEGYQLKADTLTAFIGNDNEITPEQDAEDTAKYTFEMPDSDVIIFAEFEEMPAANNEAPKMMKTLTAKPATEGDVAKIGDTGYATLADAVDAANPTPVLPTAEVTTYDLTKAEDLAELAEVVGQDGFPICDFSNGLSLSGSGLYTLQIPDCAYKFAATEEAGTSDYGDWYADYTVSFDKPVAKDSMGLVGYYASWKIGLGFLAPQEVPANVEVPLLNTMMNSSNWTYEQIIQQVGEFYCGAFNLSSDNNETTMTVKLRIYDPKEFDDPKDIRNPELYKENENTYTIKEIQYKLTKNGAIPLNATNYTVAGTADSDSPIPAGKFYIDNGEMVKAENDVSVDQKTAYFTDGKSVVVVDDDNNKTVTTQQTFSVKTDNLPSEVQSKIYDIEASTSVSGVELTTEGENAGLQKIVNKALEDTEKVEEIKAADELEVKVDVVVTPKAYTANSALRFDLTPVATLVAKDADGTETARVEGIKVTNEMIDQTQNITVSVFSDFEPKTVLHVADNGETTSYTKGQTPSSSTFTYDGTAKKVTLIVHHFSDVLLFSENYVAMIGEQGYETLQGAVNAAATDGSTTDIVMLANTEEATVTIPTNTKIVLDLAGKTITGKLNINQVVCDLTINDSVGGGGITNSTSNAIYIYTNNSGKVNLTINGGNFAYTGTDQFTDQNVPLKITAQNTAANMASTVNITGGAFTSSTTYGANVTLVGEMNISGGTFTGANQAALKYSGKATSSNKLTITGNPTFTGSKGLEVSSYGNVDIQGGTYTALYTSGYTGGVYCGVSNAVLTISGGSFNYSYAAAKSGAAYLSACNATISGGTFTNNAEGGNALYYSKGTNGSLRINGSNEGRFVGGKNLGEGAPATIAAITFDQDPGTTFYANYTGRMISEGYWRLGRTQDFVKVGETTYEDIYSLMQTAGDSYTAELLGDYPETVTIPAGKTLTLDLKGHTITGKLNVEGTLTLKDSVGTGGMAYDGTTNALLEVYNNASLTIEGGTYILSDHAPIRTSGTTYSFGSSPIPTQPILNIKGGTIRYTGTEDSCAVYCEGAMVTVSGGTIESDHSSAFVCSRNCKIEINENNGPVVIRGGIIDAESNGQAIQVIGKENPSDIVCDLVIKGGTFTGRDATLWLMADMSYKLEGGTYNVFEASSPILLLTNNDGPGTSDYHNITGGIYHTGSKLVVKWDDTGKTSRDPIITGGTFNNENTYEWTYNAYDYASSWREKFTNGEYPGYDTLDKYLAAGEEAWQKVGLKFERHDYEGNEAYYVYTGKETSMFPEGMQAEGYYIVPSTVVTTGNYVDVVDQKPVNYVAQIGETKYETLAEAFTAANELGTATIVMIADTNFTFNTATYAQVDSGKNITLDLNGKVIISASTNGSTSQLIDNRGTLTIKDTAGKDASGHYTGKIIHGANPVWVYDGSGSYNGSYASNLIRNYGGTVTIDGGYLENASLAGQTGSAAYVVDNNNNEASGTTSLVINDGELVAAWTAIRQFVQRTDKENNVTVNGGSVTAARNCFMLNASALNIARLTINGGTFTTNKSGASGTSAVVQLWQANTSTTKMAVEITNGLFKATGGGTRKIIELDFTNAGEGEAKKAIQISGGYYNLNDSSLSDYVVAGKQVVDTPDGPEKTAGYIYTIGVSPVAPTVDEDAKEESKKETEVPSGADEGLAEKVVEVVIGEITNNTAVSEEGATNIQSPEVEGKLKNTISGLVDSTSQLKITVKSVATTTEETQITEISATTITTTKAKYDVKPWVTIETTDEQGVKTTETRVITNDELEAADVTISFRLAVPESMTGNQVLVKHYPNDTGTGAPDWTKTYAVQGNGSNRYVDLEANSFSIYEIEDYSTTEYVALNVNTNTPYAVLAEGLSAATSGQTVILLKDLTENKKVDLVEVAPNVTLDLNGKNLKAGIVIAFGLVEDSSSSSSGKLLVEKNCFTYPGGKGMATSGQNVMPVWDTNGYKFYAVYNIKEVWSTAGGNPRFWLRPESLDIGKILAADSGGVGVFVQIQYKRAGTDNYEVMTVRFGRGLIDSFLAGYGGNENYAMYVTLLGTENISDLKATTFLAKVTNQDINAFDFSINGNTVPN